MMQFLLILPTATGALFDLAGSGGSKPTDSALVKRAKVLPRILTCTAKSCENPTDSGYPFGPSSRADNSSTLARDGAPLPGETPRRAGADEASQSDGTRRRTHAGNPQAAG